MPITLLLPPQIFRLSYEPSHKLQTRGRLVGAMDAIGAMASTDFDRSVNPISTRGVRLCPSHYCWPPRFSDFPTTLRERKKNVVNTCDDMWGGSCCFRFSDVLVADIEVPPSMTRRDLIFFSSVHGPLKVNQKLPFSGLKWIFFGFSKSGWVRTRVLKSWVWKTSLAAEHKKEITEK